MNHLTPFQYPSTRRRGEDLSITRVSGTVGEPVAAEPGTVVSCSRRGVAVAAVGGTIGVEGLAAPGDPGAGPEALLGSLRAGDRLQ